MPKEQSKQTSSRTGWKIPPESVDAADVGAVIYVSPQITARFVDLNDVQQLDSTKNSATCWLTVTATYWPLMASMPGFHNWLGYSVGGVFTFAAVATWIRVVYKARKLETGLVPVPAQVFFDAIKPYAVACHDQMKSVPWYMKVWARLPWSAGGTSSIRPAPDPSSAPSLGDASIGTRTHRGTPAAASRSRGGTSRRDRA